MLHFKYKPFLSVTVLHNFYFDNTSHDFVFAADADTLQTLTSLGLRARNADGKLVLYQELDANDIPFTAIDAVADLYFTVQPKTDVLNIMETPPPSHYWFSNLREDGTYSNVLTRNATLTLADALPDVSGQVKGLNFALGTISTFTLKKLTAAVGWTTVKQYPVDAQMTDLKLDVNTGGLYLLETKLTDNSVTQQKMILHNALAAAGRAWSILHLQIKPGDTNQAYTIPLLPREAVWQYYLVESKHRATTLDPTKLSLKYTAAVTSRYPVNVAMSRIDPGAYSTATKKFVDGIKEDTANIRDVYLFETGGKLKLFDGEQPEVKIIHNGVDLAGRITIPRRSMNNAIITYKL
ncbi:hypothetical protein [Chryseolinea soli]|uniref:Uncharacterized protein n=1 Tax=Chryseolinea soli TaxID=2321403 RepID=A0A385SV12_9BACT|nr:hypothetical protein [Chryseolinea soli]AYB33987.1 hypothetical protein D4L85_26920 [Chryseolinea soli]